MTYPTGAGAHDVAVADLNGDGIARHHLVNAVADDVSVLMGNGNGTFQPAQNYKVGSNPIRWRWPTSTETASPTSSRPTAATTPSACFLAKARHLRAQETFPTGNDPRTVAVGDFTGDGQVDIVTSNLGDDTASVLLGRGDGTFSFGAQQSAPSAPLAPFQVVVADLTGDGIPDIITANRPDNSVSVLLGNPDGSFQTKETYPTGQGPFSVAVADLTGDGIPDIVTANYGGGRQRAPGQWQRHIPAVL